MKKEIIDKYQKILSEKISSKYYHPNSLQNFINHFEKISNQNDKEIVQSLLNDYLDIIINDDIDNSADSKRLFKSYIQPIGQAYSRNMPFNVFIDPAAILFLTVIVNLVLLFFNPHFIIFILLILIGLFGTYKMHVIKKSNMCYSINW